MEARISHRFSFPSLCRSLNMDCENQDKDKDGNPSTTGSFNNNNTNNSKYYIQGKVELCMLNVFLDFQVITYE